MLGYSLLCLIITQLCIFSIVYVSPLSMTCGGAASDPHQCAYTIKGQKCFRSDNVTKCDTNTWTCLGDCCDGWKLDMKGNCSIPTPTSRCPKSEVDVTKGDITFCEDNTFCQEGEVCCSNVCTKPLSEDQCLYDNELHTIGETITKTNDVCRQCYCYGNGGRSATMVCTETNCTWGPNDIPQNYTPPALFISRVTGHRLTVYVLPHDNIANLYKSYIFGLDFRGNFLNVSISKDTFHHCLCRNATDIVHIRTDPDEYGNYNDSIFHVDIIDLFRPVFTNCPDNQQILNNETAIWVAPSVTDNVGIQKLQKPDIQNNTQLAPGTYTLTYQATDWSNNKADCTFTITVNKINPAVPARHTDRVSTTIILCGSIGGAIFFALVLLSLYLVCRTRNEQHDLIHSKRGHSNFSSREKLAYGSNIDN